MKKIIALSVLSTLLSCGQYAYNIFEQATQEIKMKTVNPNEIGLGLKEALSKGVHKEVTKLTNYNGFYKNDLVKIGLPSSLNKLSETLKNMGMSKVSDKGVELLNHAAEEAVKEAKPIVIKAIKEMTFSDAKSILMGSQNAATTYLENKTKTDLYAQFTPIVKSSLAKVSADKHWEKITKQYNDLPFVKEKVNPDLVDYVTNEAIKGVFTMIALEEKNIRTSIDFRDTQLLKEVFALQDKK